MVRRSPGNPMIVSWTAIGAAGCIARHASPEKAIPYGRIDDAWPGRSFSSAAASPYSPATE